MNYIIIAIVILALMALNSYAWHRHTKNVQSMTWYQLYLATMVLEIQARAAMEQQQVRDRHKDEP